MTAHAADLRSEVEDDELVRQIRADFRAAGIDGATRAALAFAEKLTRTPSAMTAADVAVLRKQGYDDRAITDLVQVTAYFNYINRVADGLGVDLEGMEGCGD